MGDMLQLQVKKNIYEKAQRHGPAIETLFIAHTQHHMHIMLILLVYALNISIESIRIQ